MNHTAHVVILMPAILAACPAAEATAITEKRPAERFDSVRIMGAASVTITVGAAPGVALAGAASDVRRVTTAIDDGTLTIDARDLDDLDEALEITLATPALEALRLSGATEVTVGGLDADHLELRSSGAAKVSLAGRVKSLDLSLSGASAVEALALRADEVRVDASGASSVEVHAEERLEIEASGATQIRYAGDPERVKEDISGISAVTRVAD